MIKNFRILGVEFHHTQCGFDRLAIPPQAAVGALQLETGQPFQRRVGDGGKSALQVGKSVGEPAEFTPRRGEEKPDIRHARFQAHRLLQHRRGVDETALLEITET